MTTQSKIVFKVGTVQTMMSEFNYKSDKFYYSDEGTKASSERNTLEKEKKFSRQGPSEYHDFIKEHQAVTTKEKNLTLKYE